MGTIDRYKDQIQQLCSSHRVDSMYLFGSADTDSFTEKSDIDLLVTFEKFDISSYFGNYMDLKAKLEFLFSRNVDLVESQTIKNPILKRSIDRTKKLIYGRED